MMSSFRVFALAALLMARTGGAEHTAKPDTAESTAQQAAQGRRAGRPRGSRSRLRAATTDLVVWAALSFIHACFARRST